MSNVSTPVKRALTVLTITLLVVFAVLVFATNAQGSARFISVPIGGLPPIPIAPVEHIDMPVMEWRVVHVEPITYTPPAPVRKLVQPTRLPSPERVSEGCYAEPGTPPHSVMWRESKGNPKARNRSGAAGCWQFMPGTWGGYKGYDSADQAPVEIQNERAKQVWADGDGACHWRATTDQC